MITGYVLRPDYVRESEPKGFPHPSYSPARFSPSTNALSVLASRALIAYNKACAARHGKKPARSVDLSALKELTEDKLIYRRKVDL